MIISQKQNRIFIFFLLMLFSIQGFSQFNFFTSDTPDSTSKNFYSQNFSTTIVGVWNIKQKDAGITCLLHNQENKVSYYVSAKTNITSTYTISGNEINGTGIQQKLIPYRTLDFSVGIARGVTRNWILYIGNGFVAKRSYFENSTTDTYTYSIPHHGMWYNIHIGGMYVTNSKLTLMGGMDTYSRTINFGIGYTW